MSDRTLENLEEGGHTYAHAFNAKAVRKEIWRITLYLTILTIVELALGFLMMPWPEESFKRHAVKGIVLALMVWKAFYIIGYFMHLKHEVRNMIMVLAIPACLFIWFISSFLGDGVSYKHDRLRFNRYQAELAAQPMPKHKEHAEQQPEQKPDNTAPYQQ